MTFARPGLWATTAAAALTLTAGPAHAISYVTDSPDPWRDIVTGAFPLVEDATMDAAFGADDWTKYRGFKSSVYTNEPDFIFIEGGGGATFHFTTFMLGLDKLALGDYLKNGGVVFVNAARWNYNPAILDIGGTGMILSGSYTNPNTGSYVGELTPEGLAAGLDANGAGSTFTGNGFSGDFVTGGTCYVTGDYGCVFAGMQVGAGHLFVGGQTSPYFHSANGLQLRVNELNFAASFIGVPEPASWAMMLAGLGIVAAGMRRRPQLRVRFA